MAITITGPLYALILDTIFSTYTSTKSESQGPPPPPSKKKKTKNNNAINLKRNLAESDEARLIYKYQSE
jgi:hypothetical protein